MYCRYVIIIEYPIFQQPVDNCVGSKISELVKIFEILSNLIVVVEIYVCKIKIKKENFKFDIFQTQFQCGDPIPFVSNKCLPCDEH